MDASERRATVLRAIVEEYVVTAQPVGSQAIAQSGALGVSSATVRNDMTQLERDGYITQPHTSAGRVPTDLGYRYFVDNFTAEGMLPVGQRRALADFFTSTHRAIEDLLHSTSQILSGLTSHAAVVVGPPTDAAPVRAFQLVRLRPGLVLAVAVLSDGGLEKRVLTVDERVDDACAERAGRAVARALVDVPLAHTGAPAPTGDALADDLAARACAALVEHGVGGSEPLYVSGASRLAAERTDFGTAEGAARLLGLLEQQVVVVSLMQHLLDQGVNVSIGSENELDELRDCSLVLAPYSVGGQSAGTVGVLGPTRMDYRQALAAVAAVSDRLGDLLSAETATDR